jgi:hypothetical protein
MHSCVCLGCKVFNLNNMSFKLLLCFLYRALSFRHVAVTDSDCLNATQVQKNSDHQSLIEIPHFYVPHWDSNL